MDKETTYKFVNLITIATSTNYDDKLNYFNSKRNEFRGKFLNTGIGYGGLCFWEKIQNVKIFNKVKWLLNETVKPAIDMNKWEKTLLYKKACRMFIIFSGLKVAMIGLTFKLGTDDFSNQEMDCTVSHM